MESYGRDELHAQLHETERGEAAAWMASPRQPRWLPAAFAVFAALLVLTVGALHGSARTTALALLVTLELGYVHWERRRRGAWPAGRPPRGLGRLMALCAFGLLLVVLATWLVGVLAGTWAAAAVAAVATGLLLVWYGKAFEAAAGRVRARLA